jgi:HAE1 family hydrophobic/amphiphilic exporter-1
VATVLSLFVVPSFYVLMKQLEASWFPTSANPEPLPGEKTEAPAESSAG